MHHTCGLGISLMIQNDSWINKSISSKLRQMIHIRHLAFSAFIYSLITNSKNYTAIMLVCLGWKITYVIIELEFISCILLKYELWNWTPGISIKPLPFFYGLHFSLWLFLLVGQTFKQRIDMLTPRLSRCTSHMYIDFIFGTFLRNP